MERTKVLQLKLRLLEKDVQSNVETLKELKSTEDRNVTELQEKIGLLHDTEQEVNIVADISRYICDGEIKMRVLSDLAEMDVKECIVRPLAGR